MTFFTHRNRELYAEDVAIRDIAEQFGTPCYVYSRAALTDGFRAFDGAFASRDHLVCYAVKANSNLAVLNVFARLGSGFDIVSGGELARVLAAGGDPGKVVFSGVGKTAEEMRHALNAGVSCFNVESESELARLNRVAGETGKVARFSLRVNPDVDAQTHPYIATGLKENKFGVAYGDAPRLYALAAGMPNLRAEGVDCHIGSQLTDLAPIAAALDRVLALIDRLESGGVRIAHVDVGGGLGICYRDETPPAIADYARTLLDRLGNRKLRLLLEPGRLLTGNAGVLVTRVEYLKRGEAGNFAIVDAAMNDLLRPALYDAWHDVTPVTESDGNRETYDIVGPVCESGDFLARARCRSAKATCSPSGRPARTA